MAAWIGGELEGEWITCICTAESLHCPPKTVTTLFIGYLSAVVVAVQSISCVQLFATLWNIARQAPLSSTVSWSLLRFMCIESVIPSNHPILCQPLLLPSLFPSIRVSSNDAKSALCKIRWPNIGASATVLPMNIQS